ncbi:hypothetical protein BDL97_04G086900 [Sphagnum fallax]|nr:hypothetical protein BDL97_04G086900 [Sphagnum fallax]
MTLKYRRECSQSDVLQSMCSPTSCTAELEKEAEVEVNGAGCSYTVGSQTSIPDVAKILSSMSLSGISSEEIGSLSDLQDLELSFNPHLGGTLPAQLGYLTQLQTLSMQSCSFTGPIPASLSNLFFCTFL